MRLIEAWLRRHGDPAGGPQANFVRFQNSTALRFPASELEALVPEPREQLLDAAALKDALRSGALRHVQLVPGFAGLLGAAGALPVHYTERVAAHGVTFKDAGPRAFLDIFANRSLQLFYEGWRKYRLEQQSEAQGDRFLPLLLALAGLGSAALRGRQHGVLDESLGHFAASLRQRPASSVQIGRVLSAYFEAPVVVEQFVGRWYEVPEAQQSCLGRQHCVLGGGAMVGARVWQRDLRMRIVVGPLGHAAFVGFLPGGAKAHALREWLALFSGVTLEYEVQLVLRGPDVRGVTLGAAAGARLGWDSFLAPSGQADRADVCYELMTL